MGNDGRYDRRRNGRGRAGSGAKRRRAGKKLFFVIELILLAAMIFSLIRLYVRMEEMQKKLDRREVVWEESAGAGGRAKETSGYGYVVRAEGTEADRPVERSHEEVLQRLDELGHHDETIMKIRENASRYPDELLAALANNPEMADFAAGYLDGGTNVAGGLTETEKEQEFPLFLQWDPRWGYQPYGEKSCIGLSGCGPTCLSMVLYYLTGNEELTPDVTAAYSMENGYYVEGSGTAWLLMEDLPKRYGVTVQSVSLSFNNMIASLDNGGIIICAMGRGDFTTAGHFIVIYGYDSEGFLVNDPNCVARSSRKWSYSEIDQQIKNIWVYTM